MTVEHTLTTKAVNSKQLLAVVRELEIIFTDFGIKWASDPQRITAVEIVDEMMEMLYDEGKISQYNVICDYRNNTINDMAAGIYFLTVTYRQTNCLNTTMLEYRIVESGTLEMDFDFDY